MTEKTAVKTNPQMNIVMKKKMNLQDKPVLNVDRWTNIFDKFYKRIADSIINKVSDDELVDVIIDSMSGEEAKQAVKAFVSDMKKLPALLKHVCDSLETSINSNISKYEIIKKRVDKINDELRGQINSVDKKIDNILAAIDKISK